MLLLVKESIATSKQQEHLFYTRYKFFLAHKVKLVLEKIEQIKKIKQELKVKKIKQKLKK